jgi:hypothetical protein
MLSDQSKNLVSPFLERVELQGWLTQQVWNTWATKISIRI